MKDSQEEEKKGHKLRVLLDTTGHFVVIYHLL
jgi:hypothetical protein